LKIEGVLNQVKKVLPESFYHQPTLQLAPALLGKVLIHYSADCTTSGMIVETEAYMGAHDRAAHSYGNRRTKRTEVMFGANGFAYVYQMHQQSLLNVVSGGEGTPEAVLIRALEPVEGIELMRVRRKLEKRVKSGGVANDVMLTNGPGKLCQAMGIDRSFYGVSFVGSKLQILQGEDVAADHVCSGPRIGIENTGEARFYPWRFWIAGNRFVSKGRKAFREME
jgi:DNA-3-methyladenine glycosylase